MSAEDAPMARQSPVYAPLAGVPRSRGLTSLQREADREARLAISEELVHEREQITGVYPGR